jgi:threonine-phosphate decarboxylase
LAYAIKPRKAVVAAPTFSDYERALKAAGAETRHHRLYEENGFGLTEGMAATIAAERPDLVFVCNPNNPTGCLTSNRVIEGLAKACAGVGCVLVVDECFMDFVPDCRPYTAKGLIGKYPNVVVLKAFTKIFAMPGLRLGYALCADNEVTDKLYFHGPDWGVSAAAQAAGTAALAGCAAYIEKTAAYVEAEKAEMRKAFEGAGLKVFGSAANYLFFKNPHDIDLASELYGKHGICIRSCANYRGLDKRFNRAGILRHEQNGLLINAVTSLLEGFDG